MALTFIFCVLFRPSQCPQCNRNCSIKDVRKLYASPGVAVDEESLKDNDWRKKEAEWQKREAALHLQVEKLTKVDIGQDIGGGKRQGPVYDAGDSSLSEH
ncbi:hypothetical protein JHK87_007710 [Glycine soja]|nr:hypothetical protein JHK87_007710 [Glycine soja]